MKMTVIGCWAPYPAAFGACSCYLVEVAGQKLLLDIGHGSYGRLNGTIHGAELDALVVSHFHPDHYMDISCARHAVSSAIRLGLRQERLPVYVPREPAEDYQRVARMTDGLELVVIDDLPDKEANLGAVKLQFFATNHPLPNFGTIISFEGKKIVYTGDTGEWDGLAKLAHGADLLICEASLLEQDADYGSQRGHLTAKGAAQVAREAQVKKLLITHLWPEYDLEVLHNEAKSVFPEAILAKEGLVIEI